MSTRETIHIGCYLELPRFLATQSLIEKSCADANCSRFGKETSSQFCPACGSVLVQTERSEQTHEQLTLKHLDGLEGGRWQGSFKQVRNDADLRNVKFFAVPVDSGYRVASFAAGVEVSPVDLRENIVEKTLEVFRQDHAELIMAVEREYGVKLEPEFGAVCQETSGHEVGIGYKPQSESFQCYTGWFYVAPFKMGTTVEEKTCCVSKSCSKFGHSVFMLDKDPPRFCEQCGGALQHVETEVPSRIQVTRRDVYYECSAQWDDALQVFVRDTNVPDCYVPLSGEFGTWGGTRHIAYPLKERDPEKAFEVFQQKFASFLREVEEKFGVVLEPVFGTVSFIVGPQHAGNWFASPW